MIIGLGIAAVGIIGRSIAKHAPNVAKNLEQKLGSLPKATSGPSSSSPFAAFTEYSKYYKGGFETKMTKREASLILGVSQTANKLKIREAHKRIMLMNHPDRGGSPYIASKLNEAKDLLENNSPQSKS